MHMWDMTYSYMWQEVEEWLTSRGFADAAALFHKQVCVRVCVRERVDVCVTERE